MEVGADGGDGSPPSPGGEGVMTCFGVCEESKSVFPMNHPWGVTSVAFLPIICPTCWTLIFSCPLMSAHGPGGLVAGWERGLGRGPMALGSR